MGFHKRRSDDSGLGENRGEGVASGSFFGLFLLFFSIQVGWTDRSGFAGGASLYMGGGEAPSFERRGEAGSGQRARIWAGGGTARMSSMVMPSTLRIAVNGAQFEHR